MDLLWTDFVNSEWHDWRGSKRTEERLDKPEWLASYVDAWHLGATVPPTKEDIQKLKTFRSALRTMATTVAAGESLTDKDISVINHVLDNGFVTRKIARNGDGWKFELVPVKRDWGSIMAEIAADFADTIVNRAADRIRVCENTDCLWVFYDDTRNRSKRYCDDKLCGNLMKVRRFRSRAKLTTPTSTN